MENRRIVVIAIAAFILGGLLIWFLKPSVTSESMADHQHAEAEVGQMWTCSMHPQVMQPEPGDCPLCGMDLIPAEAGADGLAPDQFKMTENAMALANIQTTVVGSGNHEQGLTLSGKIKENEEANTVQASYFDGRVERLNINAMGDNIRKGQLLATIYSPQLVAAQQELLTAASLKASQPALYKAVKNKLKLLKLTERQIKVIEFAGEVRENFPVYATVSGTVTEKLVDQGDYIKQGQPLFKVANLNSVWAVFDAYESQVSSLNVGQKIEVKTNAFPNKPYQATISFIDPMLNNSTRTVQVRVVLNNAKGELKPGMFVSGVISRSASATNETIVIPSSAVLWTGERSLVYVKASKDEPIFEMREVTLGNRVGENYSIVSGLQNGEEIVTNGTFTVDAAAQLQGKRSMMNRHTTAPSDENLGLSVEIQNGLKEVFEDYFKLKDALVGSKEKEASDLLGKVLTKLEMLPLTNLNNKAKDYLKMSVHSLKQMRQSNNLDQQRAHFVNLNEALVPLVKGIEEVSSTVYVQRCPMANNNQGAMWLSDEKEVRNPYYGDMMLTCGSVIDSLRTSQ